MNLTKIFSYYVKSCENNSPKDTVWDAVLENISEHIKHDN